MDTMPSARAEETPPVDATSSSRVSPSESSRLPPRHLEFPEPSRATDSVRGRSPPSSPTASPSTKENPLEYFRDKIPSEGTKGTKCTKRKKSDREERIRSLVHAAEGFSKAPGLKQTFEDASTLLDINVLNFIHIAHHVQLSKKLNEKLRPGVGQLTPALDKTAEDLSIGAKEVREKLRQGEGQLTPALEKTAEDLSLGAKQVRDQHKWGRRYMQLAQHKNGGPGILFLTGPHVRTTWQRNLQDRDVPYLLDYRNEHMPYHFAKATEFDAPASRFIIRYMFKRGWRKEMFASIPTEFVWLTRHVDLEQLLEELARESKPGVLPPDDSARMDMLLEAAEEPDVTRFMRPFAEDDMWMRSEFPAMMQPVGSMETYFANSWTTESFPVHTQQDHPQDQIDAVASSHTHEHDWLQQCGDASMDPPLPQEVRHIFDKVGLNSLSNSDPLVCALDTPSATL